MTRPDTTVRPPISGSAALYEAAREHAVALGETLSGYVDAAVRARLVAGERPVPPPLPPKHNGPKPKRRRAQSRTGG